MRLCSSDPATLPVQRKLYLFPLQSESSVVVKRKKKVWAIICCVSPKQLLWKHSLVTQKAAQRVPTGFMLTFGGTIASFASQAADFPSS